MLFFSVGSGTFIAPLAAKLAHIPALIRISGTVIHRLYPAVLRCFDRLLLQMTDKILVPAEFLKKQYVREFKINPQKVKVILNGVDLPEHDAMYYRAKARDELSLSQTAKVIGMVANFTENKGHYYLIKAIPQILKRFPHTYFLLIGEGPTRMKLEQLVSELHIEAHVRFLGYQASVEKLISSCDVGVLCSMMEICNNSILEMMTLRIPVVATNVGGTPEIIKHDVNGLLVPPKDAVALGNAIVYLLAHPSISKKLGQNGRTWVAEKYNREDMVVAYQNEILNSDKIH
jgi:glycosyltransferase involved in cell wall biosynthesis